MLYCTKRHRNSKFKNGLSESYAQCCHLTGIRLRMSTPFQIVKEVKRSRKSSPKDLLRVLNGKMKNSTPERVKTGKSANGKSTKYQFASNFA